MLPEYIVIFCINMNALHYLHINSIVKIALLNSIIESGCQRGLSMGFSPIAAKIERDLALIAPLQPA